MDPLFERRKLTKKVNIHSQFLQQNIQISLLTQLKHKFQGRCSAEGYIQPDSLTITKYSYGRPNMLEGGVDYHVTFQADICLPHAGQRFKITVSMKSKIGIHAELPPLKILLPRDLHIGNAAFESVKDGDEVEFEVVGTPNYTQGDKYIFVVGKMVVVEPTTPPFPPEPLDLQSESVPAFDLGPSAAAGDEKSVTVTASTTPTIDKPMRRKLKRGDGDTE